MVLMQHWYQEIIKLQNKKEKIANNFQQKLQDNYILNSINSPIELPPYASVITNNVFF